MAAASAEAQRVVVTPTREKTPVRKASKHRALLVIVLVLLRLIAATLIVLRMQGPAVSTVHAKRGDLDRRIVASGRVLALSVVTVSANSAGLVVAVGATVGQRVNAGDLLLQLDDAEARASLLQSKAAVEQARARVVQQQRVGTVVATEGLHQAEILVKKAELDYARTQKLAESGAVPPTEREVALQNVEVQRAKLLTAKAQQVASTPLGADARVALGAVLQAEAQQAGAEIKLKQTRLVASSAGTVLSRTVEQGDIVQPGRALMTLAVESDIQLSFQSDERNLAHLALGQKAIASAEAFPNERFDAEVNYLAPSIDPQRGTVEVRLKVPLVPKYLLPEMAISIDLLVASRRGVLLVPSEVVRSTKVASSSWVLVAEQKRVVRKVVLTGIQADGMVEILSGVTEQDELILPNGKELAPGTRVRTTALDP